MKKLLKYSKLLHWLTYLCLCLPFFYTGCKKAVAAPAQTVQIDTTSVNPELSNAVRLDSIAINKERKSIVEEESKSEEPEKELSEKLSEEYAFLQPILVSDDKTFSGLAMIIDSGRYVAVFSVFIYFLLSILSLSIKHFDSSAIKSIVLLEVLALLFLFISEPIGV